MTDKWQWGDEIPPTSKEKALTELEHLMRMAEFAPSNANYENLQKFIEYYNSSKPYF